MGGVYIWCTHEPPNLIKFSNAIQYQKNDNTHLHMGGIFVVVFVGSC